MNRQCERIIGIARHRLSTDGDGVTTLVAFHGCPLHCHYCLNPQSLGDGSRFREYSPEELYAETRVDELYFMATNGGVTFGGVSHVCVLGLSASSASYVAPNGSLILRHR
jgi:pyruvate formate lyase activating enzyme